MTEAQLAALERLTDEYGMTMSNGDRTLILAAVAEVRRLSAENGRLRDALRAAALDLGRGDA